MSMQEDNLMLNNGEWFDRPEEDVKLALEQKRKLNNAKPLIRDVIKRLEARIEFYKDVDNNPVPLEEDAETYQKFAWLHREMRRVIQDEKEFIESML